MKKGLSFELLVYEALQEALFEKKLGLNPENCEIFHQKAYFSRDRNRSIKVDISIEVSISGQETPSIIWVWECKDYSGVVPVDQLEKFHATLEEIGSDKTKGTVITSNGVFAQSALSYAISKGIGIARLMPDGKMLSEISAISPFAPVSAIALFLIHLFGMKSVDREKLRKEQYVKEFKELHSALCDIDFKSINQKFYGLTPSRKMVSSFHDFIRIELVNWDSPYSKESKDNSEDLSILTDLARKAIECEKYKRVREDLEKKLIICREIGDHINEAMIVYGIGLTHLRSDNLDEAMEFLHKAQKLARKNNDLELLFYITRDLGIIRLTLGYEGAGKQLLKQAIEIGKCIQHHEVPEIEKLLQKYVKG